jgi:hypothetical protein
MIRPDGGNIDVSAAIFSYHLPQAPVRAKLLSKELGWHPISSVKSTVRHPELRPVQQDIDAAKVLMAP